MQKLLVVLFTAFLSSLAAANEVAVAPAVEADGLPPLGATWLSENPYRGNPVALAIGQQAYNQACARCHGADASTNAAPAPDLRNLNRFCKRISDAELNAACRRDNDAWFAKSVRKGKIIVGVTHMPPWQGVLKQELAWAIQVFFESRAEASK
ncbi:MAG: c-type cytochrome [Gammaproteobacteria bacterium]|nr:c-type cytochrome [Gammaproteobacteria bacterium]MBU1603319.1 c-type cytochrome [Gammaproteobacteria bacterium]MBU2432839.1 c-type cytochrome [Gammaproteobacteria bacterium]MBU2450082.1 c-type cytochrome [Gammaproteobacteria bacterium]